MKTTMQTVTSHAIAFVLGMVIVAAGCVWLKFKPSLPSVLATPSSDLAKVDKETLKCQTVIVYKEKAKDKLGLPESVKSDAEQKVLAATQVKSSDRPTTVSAVLDTGSGLTSMYLRHDPYPWLGFDTKRELGIAYGFKSGGATTRVFGKVDLLTIKALRGGLIGNVDADGDWYVGAGVSMRW